MRTREDHGRHANLDEPDRLAAHVQEVREVAHARHERHAARHADHTCFLCLPQLVIEPPLHLVGLQGLLDLGHAILLAKVERLVGDQFARMLGEHRRLSAPHGCTQIGAGRPEGGCVLDQPLEFGVGGEELGAVDGAKGIDRIHARSAFERHAVQERYDRLAVPLISILAAERGDGSGTNGRGFDRHGG